jgi:hypothetical protein
MLCDSALVLWMLCDAVTARALSGAHAILSLCCVMLCNAVKGDVLDDHHVVLGKELVRYFIVAYVNAYVYVCECVYVLIM